MWHNSLRGEEMNNLTIRKSNDIVQKTMNRFTYKQNQLMALLLGKYVNLKTDECIDTKVSIEELREVLSVQSQGGNAYERIRRAIELFGERGSVGIYTEKNGKPKWTWMPYFTKIELTEDGVTFNWNEGMKPYLIKLKNNYTQYLANDYLKLKSVHSQNLYEQLKSVENYEKLYRNKPTITIEELRNIFQTNGKKAYDRWGALKQLVLDKAIDEINDVTDIQVSYQTLKKGRTVIALEFDIKRKGYNYTKKQKEGLPDWYEKTEQTQASPELLAEVEAYQKKHLEEEVKALQKATEEPQTSKRQLVLNYYKEHPEATVSEIKEATGVDSKTIRRVLSKK